MRSLPFELFVGVRYFKAKRRQKGISLTTLISMGGVTIGVAALIATLSVMAGFAEDLRAKILGTNSHIVVTDMGQGELFDAPRVMAQIKTVPHVVAVTPFIFRQVLLATDQAVLGVVLRGIDPKRESAVTDLEKNMVEGHLSDLSQPPSPASGPSKTASPKKKAPGIIIGKELAARLGLQVGDPLSVLSPVTKGGPAKWLGGAVALTPKIRVFRVTGIFDSGMFEYDTTLAYVALSEAQSFFNLSEGVSGIEVKVDDIFLADQIRREIESRLSFPYQVRDWKQMNRNLFSALQLERIIMFIILILIVLVASFNIVSTLTMTVAEKSREIAILKAMGASKKSILGIFMFEGLVIGGMGVVLGVPLGVAICRLLQRFYVLPSDVYYLSHLPVRVQSMDLLWVASSAMLISLLATLYPSWQAAKLDPAEALRYE